MNDGPEYVDASPSEPMPQYGYPVNSSTEFYNSLIRTESLKDDRDIDKVTGDVPKYLKLTKWALPSKEIKIANFTPKQAECMIMYQHQLKMFARSFETESEQTPMKVLDEEMLDMLFRAALSNATNDGKHKNTLLERLTQLTSVQHSEVTQTPTAVENQRPAVRWG